MRNMGKDVHYILERGTKLTDEEITMIEAARSLPETFDRDNPPIDPVATPEQYNALMRDSGEFYLNWQAQEKKMSKRAIAE